MTELMINPAMIKKISTVALFVIFAGTIGVPAADSAAILPDGMDDANVSTVTVKRDPFWPVGYKPIWLTDQEQNGKNRVVAGIEGTDWNKAMGKVSIQGVSSRSDNEFYAIINGQVKSTGETVSVKVGAVNYTWMIDGISPPSSVKLRRVSAQ